MTVFFSHISSIWLLTLCLSTLLSLDVTAAAEKPFILGIFPSMPVLQLEKNFTPIANDLTIAMGNRVMLRTSSSFETFYENLQNEIYDIALIQPFDYVSLKGGAYEPIARMNEPLEALFLVLTDSKIKNLQSLRGKTIALPPQNSAVSYLARQTLREHALVPGKDLHLVYTRNHKACIQQLRLKKAEACVSAQRALRWFKSNDPTDYPVVQRSKAIPHILFVVHRRIPSYRKELLRQRIINWTDEQEEGVLSHAGLIDFVSTSRAEYLPVLQIREQVLSQ